MHRLTRKTDANTISGFFGEHRWLSNFWRHPVTFDGVTAPTAEHHYQAAKAEAADDRARIVALPTPGEVKRAGAELKERAGWQLMRRDLMLDIARAKFADPELAGLLLATRDRQLIEANDWHDIFWGVCGCPEHGYGGNVLGRILMKVRTELQHEAVRTFLESRALSTQQREARAAEREL